VAEFDAERVDVTGILNLQVTRRQQPIAILRRA